jgi:hypothetical protein
MYVAHNLTRGRKFLSYRLSLKALYVEPFPAAGGPVPTGARAWKVWIGGKGVDAEVTACEVDAAAAGLAVAVAQVAHAGGGMAIDGLPDNLAMLLLEGYPAYTAGPDMHLFRHLNCDKWHVSAAPSDPARTTASGCVYPRGGRPGVPRRAARCLIGRRRQGGLGHRRCNGPRDCLGARGPPTTCVRQYIYTRLFRHTIAIVLNL